MRANQTIHPLSLKNKRRVTRGFFFPNLYNLRWDMKILWMNEELGPILNVYMGKTFSHCINKEKRAINMISSIG